MNPQPNSHDHPEVINYMEILDAAILSLDDFRKNKKGPIDDFGTVAYENSLISQVRDIYSKLEYWCKSYGITIVEPVDLPK
jgi:hypothetical protein